MKIIDKIFRDKKSNSLIYIILAVGIVLIICSNSLPKTKELTVQSSNEASPDARLEGILSEIKGVGEVKVMVSFGKDTKNKAGESFVESVLVVADGGSSSAVREKITRAVCAALNTQSHKIEVFERKENQ